ncbi:hypothetical protein GJA_3470 [Janthinobacterium agaricidamnosum NBRC 102515 = DSM 9628]|uniref:Uncharacterized protein n=2 Tax=Janthinobacterium agaricidamnosum TaxID=55508 RepID=W0V872_9BURK|nr:hypothetical protein GJA_3470 [Janthinobacterium agaricidamnosum NBRC 102515 = DSM 9628]
MVVKWFYSGIKNRHTTCGIKTNERHGNRFISSGQVACRQNDILGQKNAAQWHAPDKTNSPSKSKWYQSEMAEEYAELL